MLEYNNFEEEQDSGSSWKVMLILLGVLFGVSYLTSVLVFFVFLRTLKWRPRVTIIPVAIFALMFGLLFLNSIGNLSSLGEQDNWNALINSYLYFSLFLGSMLGYGLIIYKVLELKRHPEYVYIRGWAYGFKYAPTPFDKFRKRRNIKALKEGNEFDYEKAPIGVIEEPVRHGDLEGTVDDKNADKASIVYRYYTEAMAHTLITGKTGSGKALHVDTELRTKEKGWITVGEAEVGDTLYDERGNHTTLLAIYQPMTPDHYEITFDNGEKVKCCGDHLWNIGDVDDGATLSTRDLLSNYSSDTEYFIKHYIDGIPIAHKILRIRRIQDAPEDYVCFTVDSDSKLFLITRQYIPTHNTVTMLSLIQNDILAGNPVCVVDFKKSPDFIYFLSKWAQENGREFYHFLSGKPGSYKNPYHSSQSTYDPLSTGSPTAKADMILNLRTWDTASEVFKKRTQDVLVSLFYLLDRTPRNLVPGIEWENGGLAQFVSALDLNNFKKMIELMAIEKQAGRLSPGDARRYSTLVDLYKELSAKTKSDLKAQIVELLSIARTLIVSNYGDWLAKGTSTSHINLMDIATSDKGPIVLFSFNQQEEPEFAKYIGSIVMSDLSRVSALKNAKGDRTEFGVYIDEFQTLDPGTVKDNLEKARSSRMYITLSLQSLDQIISSAANQGEAMANSIIDTCANFIFHDGSGYDTAEKMSKIIGKSKRYVYKTTTAGNNRLINYRVMTVDKAMVNKDIIEDWLIPPSEFQSLESPAKSNNYKATAYVINKSADDDRFVRQGGALARKIHVVVDEQTAIGVPIEFKKEIFVETTVQDFTALQAQQLEVVEEPSIHEGDWVIEDVEDAEDTKQTNQYSILPTNEEIAEEPKEMPKIPKMPEFTSSQSLSSRKTNKGVSQQSISQQKQIKTQQNVSIIEEEASPLDVFNQLSKKSKVDKQAESTKKTKETKSKGLPKLD